MRSIIVACLCIWCNACLAQSPLHFEPSYVVSSSPDLEKKFTSAYNKELLALGVNDRDQKAYIKERYKARHDFMMGMLSSGDFIVGTGLNSYVDSIYAIIAAANSDLYSDMCILISRSAIPNAFNTGDGFVVLNVGLLSRLENEAQLAFVICHESAHQMKNHVNRQLMAQAELYTDKDRKNQIQSILKSEYRVKSQLENFLLPGAMKSMRHSRKVEYEADSTGYEYYSKAGFQPEDAISVLQVLQTCDQEKYSGEINFRSMFSLNNLPFKESWISQEEESSLGVIVKEESELEDSLKTHPDCEMRIAALERLFPVGTSEVSLQPMRVKTFEQFSLTAECELIEGQLLLDNYGRAFHFAMQQWRAHPDLEYPVVRLSYILAKLAQCKKERTAGKYLSMPNPDYTDAYNSTLGFLWELGIEDSSKMSYWLLRERSENFKDTEIGYLSFVVSALGIGNFDEASSLCQEYITMFPDGKIKSEIEYIQSTLTTQSKK